MAKVKRGFSFNTMQSKPPKYSRFNLSHNHLVTMNSGKLIPLWWTEMVPGDSFLVNLYGFTRLLALSSPMMQRQDMVVRAFKVPLRLLVDNKDLQQAFTGGKTGQFIDFPMVEAYADAMTVGSLYDYLGLPLPYSFDESTKSWIHNSDTDLNPTISPFPFLAYHRIYNDWFRNEETEDELFDPFDQKFSYWEGKSVSTRLSEEGVLHYALDTLHDIAWARDYFTSALTRPQRGNQVSIPLTGSADVVPKSANSIPTFKFGDTEGRDQDVLQANSTGNPNEYTVGSGMPLQDQLRWNDPQLVVDGSTFTGIGAIALRTAMNLQAFLERNNVAGYRLIGWILAHFGVKSSNRLLDYAEYLGGITAPVNIGVVDQTSATTEGGTPQGTQTGKGQSTMSGKLCSVFAEEPCIFMVVGYITGKASYSQGLARKWTRRSFTDYFVPEFQSIGEQEILNQEIFFQWMDGPTGDTNNLDTWAYQSRYSEYKYESDSIAGAFRTSLSYWHQGRLFNERPAFNDEFVKQDLSDRVFAVSDVVDDQHYLCDFYFDVQAVRPMTRYAQSKLW